MKNTTSRTGVNVFDRINTLLSTQLKSILKKEIHNDDRINLYDVGECWVAFEKSAFLLDKMTSECDAPVVLHIKTHPFPIVMRCIHYLKVNDMCRKHIMAKRQLEYLQFLTQRIDSTLYNKWYREFVVEDN